MSQVERTLRFSRRQFLLATATFFAPEILVPKEIMYGFVEENLNARRKPNKNAKSIGTYQKGSLLRYIPYENG
ncbi:MAG: hypothetical protein NZM26_03970, partial [Patescibacteria group bacterium]|nr:hypothetical protein [Patescibacteria group bacterium]